MRKAHARFKFSNTQLLQSGFADLYVEIDKRFRIKPFIGMKQPTPFGAFLGIETFAKMTYKSRPAKHFKWALKLGNKIIQSGISDENGFIENLNISLPETPMSYEFIVYAPRGGLPKSFS